MIQRLWRLLNLRAGADIPGTIQEIEANVALRGSVLWILVCAALLACIGLDTNSTAVIIGAMLISPLMGPILGVGLGLGLNDSTLFWHGLRQLGLAMLISLGTSVLYFSLTPLGQPTPELLARTHPTLLDVLIAFFGGVAGLVSNSRAEKTNAIPGVAIATALMPPLCTVGFGLARLDWAVCFGAFYLFAINAAFISLATYLLSRLMDFPRRAYERPERQHRATLILGAVLLLMVAPSVYFLVDVYRQERERRIVEKEVVERLQHDGNEVLKWSLDQTDSVRLVRVYLSGQPVTPAQVQQLEQRLRRRRLRHYRVAVTRVNMSKEEVAQLSQEAARNLLSRMQLDAETRRAPQVQTTSAPRRAALPPPAQLLREVQAAFPGVRNLSLGRLQTAARPDSARPDTLLTVAVRWPAADTARQRRLYELLRARLRQDSLVLISR